MSRIRTIKPDFFSSEQIVECSTSARLLFVGLWCWADDAGVHPAGARGLKMEVFPGDDDISSHQVEVWVGELLRVGLLVKFTHEGQAYLQVTGWKHQKIDRPSYRYPTKDSAGSELVPFDEDSPKPRRELDEDSTRARRGPPPGMEGKGMEGSKASKKEESAGRPDRVSPPHEGDLDPAGLVASRFSEMREQLWPQDPFPLALLALKAEAVAWLTDGLSAERIIAVFAEGMQRMAAQKRSAPNSLKSFRNSLTDALADKNARQLSNGSGLTVVSEGLTWKQQQNSESIKWRMKVKKFIETGFWASDGSWGDKPTMAHPDVPVEILQEFAQAFADAGMQVPALERANRKMA